MLIVRAAQMETLGHAMLREFENEMLAHLAGFSPPLYKAIKEDPLRETIRFGIARAGKSGITFRGPLRLYLELMLLFGSYFDTDPQYPWAAEILGEGDPDSQMQRAEQLFARTRDYRTKVAGPRDEFTFRSLRRVSVLAGQELAVSSASFSDDLFREMQKVYPEKAAYVGKEAITKLIAGGVTTANRYGFSTVRATALPAVLMFAFGHGCFEDPLYPWIGRTVSDAAIADPEARAKRLEKKAVTWLNHVLAYFDSEVTA
jgi:hypothetical protein